MKTRLFLLGFVLAITFLAAGQKKPTLLPVGLSCEYRSNPMGIDDAHPRLAWTLQSNLRNQHQSAYEVKVSEQESSLKTGKGLSWHSGKVSSAQMNQVAYAGQALKPFTRYYWQVRVWDGGGNPSAWSKPAFFETAMLSATDWSAQWIGDERKQFLRDEDFYQDDPMPVLRREFVVPKRLVAARLYISGLGYYEAYINGKRVGNHLLDPGWTNFSKQVLYSTYDITPLVKKGANAIGVMLGNGWYNPLPLRLFRRFNLRDVQQTGRPCLKAQMLLRYSDGSQEIIGTDANWQTSTGPVVRNNVYLGERYDARLEQNTFAMVGKQAGIWKAATIVAGPSGVLAAQMQPPVIESTVLKPVSIKEQGRDTFVVDMGRNLAGVARIRVSGPAGQTVALRYGEDVHPDGRLNYLTTMAGQIKEIWKLEGGPGAPKNAWQEDRYTLKGQGKEVWAPRFTFHGFRYVEITGWPGKPTKEDIEALVLHADLKPDGNFACANDSLNRLTEIIRNTFLSNVFSVQSDCPGREKMGYGADMVVTAEAFMYQYNMANFYRKTVADFANDQQPDGGITEIAPYTGIADLGYGGQSGPLGWQLAFPFLQKKLFEFYGDRRIIAQQYPAIQKQLAFLQQKAVNGLFYWDISDHEALDPRPEGFSAACFYLHHARLASEFAGILQQRQDSLQYDSLAKTIQRAIVTKYHVPGTGRFDNATQSAQLFALWYGLAPEPDKTFSVLQQEFARHNHHLSTGIFSTKFLFDVMREQNKNELAYTIATRSGYPGYMHMLANDATTLWEAWKKPDVVHSMNHPMFGSVLEWMYRSLLGINALAPGFEKVQIKPQQASDLPWAKGSYHSIRGDIGVHWRRGGNTFNLDVAIPANTTAEIWLPATQESTITEGGKPLAQDTSLRVIRYEPGYAVINAGSGNYQFAVQ